MTERALLLWIVSAMLLVGCLSLSVSHVESWTARYQSPYGLPKASQITLDTPRHGAELVLVKSIALLILGTFVVCFLIQWTGSRPATRRGRATLVVLGLLVSWAMLEVPLARLARAQPQLCVPHPTLLWRLTPNLGGYAAGTLPAVRTNALGLRGQHATRRKMPGTTRVMVLGDSALFGYGVADSETFAVRLQSALDARWRGRQVEVLNAAVPGYTTFQGLQFLRENGRDFEIDYLVVGFNNDPEISPVSDRDRVPDSASVRQAMRMLYRSQVYLLIRKWALNLQLAGHARGITHVQQLPPHAQGKRVSLADFESNLNEICSLAGHIPIILLIMPRNPTLTVRSAADYRAVTRSLGSRPGVTVIDFYKAWRTMEYATFFIPGDKLHPNAAGQRLLADTVARAMSP